MSSKQIQISKYRYEFVQKSPRFVQETVQNVMYSSSLLNDFIRIIQTQLELQKYTKNSNSSESHITRRNAFNDRHDFHKNEFKVPNSKKQENVTQNEITCGQVKTKLDADSS